MTDTIAYLIGFTVTKNAMKQEVTTESRAMIYCTVDSVSQSEFYKGGEQNFRPEFKLTTASIDYHSEKEVELDGERYGIYRTYNVSPDYIELYCHRKVGVQE